MKIILNNALSNYYRGGKDAPLLRWEVMELKGKYGAENRI